MQEQKRAGMRYLLTLAGKQKLFLLLSAIFSVCSALCTFVPFIMVYRVLLLLFQGGADQDLLTQDGWYARMIREQELARQWVV